MRLLIGMVLYFLVGFAILGVATLYLKFCMSVYRTKPRVGMALGAIPVAAVASICAAVGIDVYLGTRAGVKVMVPVFILSFICWLVYSFKQK